MDRKILEAYDSDPNNICFEIDSNGLVTDIHKAVDYLNIENDKETEIRK